MCIFFFFSPHPRNRRLFFFPPSPSPPLIPPHWKNPCRDTCLSVRVPNDPGRPTSWQTATLTTHVSWTEPQRGTPRRGMEIHACNRIEGTNRNEAGFQHEHKCRRERTAGPEKIRGARERPVCTSRQRTSWCSKRRRLISRARSGQSPVHRGFLEQNTRCVWHFGHGRALTTCPLFC